MGTGSSINTSVTLGAYGFSLGGLPERTRYLAPAPAGWPLLTIERVVGPPEVEGSYLLSDELLQFRVRDQWDQIGSVRLDRSSLTVRFCSPSGFSEPAMVHPDLALPAAAASKWLGRDVYHAGAFVLDGGAWAVTGAREAGKSSLLGLLAAKGIGILADDAVAIDGDGNVLAGPRCVDLRKGAAAWLGSGDDIGMVGERRRWRVELPAVDAAVPLRGWIIPAWSDEVEWSEVPGRERPGVLIENHYLGLAPCAPVSFLDLISLPFVVFRRPRCWDIAEAAATALLDRLSAI